ncbi:helix-turn-helix domain-containing protein [Streptomyces sp. HUAS MG47]|uniref:helix-turn-helix domain-containing protein n=1 Tax=Streptomyces solicamelliae TaxID=3231716 RepID=UPI003877FFB0
MTATKFSAAAPSRAGVTHVRHRHDEKFTVVGNHLAQHPELSATAIGLGVYIQSLPDGALVGIKVLTARFREGASRIAGALRELETAGYLKRQVVRGWSAQLHTLTTWYEHPHPVDPVKRTRPTPRRQSPTSTSPPEPEVSALTTELQPAAPLLAGLRQTEPRLLLSENDVRRLAPAVQTWLERGVAPQAVTRTLAGGLPPGTIRWPGRLLAFRLREWLPPELPPAPPGPALPLPMQYCEDCHLAFRATDVDDCPGCARK